MATLAAAEHRSARVPGRLRPEIFHAGPRLARQPDADPRVFPAGLVRPWSQEPRRLRAPVSADVVQIGKFDVARVVRLRAFYGADRLSLRLQTAGGPRDGVARTLAAAEQVDAHCPGLMPRVVDRGRLLGGRVAFLIEELVDGRHPKRPEQVLRLLEPVAAQLHRVHRGVGITHERLSSVVSPHFAHRWSELVAAGLVHSTLDPVVRRLLARDDHLEVSLGHGDLVSTNILRSGERVVLIDWEYAGRQPIAFDLAKMHLNAGAPGPALDRIDRGLGGSVGGRRDHYSLAEQLALAHLQVLSRHAARHARARAAGRLAALGRQTERRVLAVHELLEVPLP